MSIPYTSLQRLAQIIVVITSVLLLGGIFSFGQKWDVIEFDIDKIILV